MTNLQTSKSRKQTSALNLKLSHLLPSLGIFPFFVFCLVFEIVPILILVFDSFIDSSGTFSIANYVTLTKPIYLLSIFGQMKGQAW